jgi:hypothetical protein
MIKVASTYFSHSLKYHFEILLNSHSSFNAFVQENAVQKYKQHSPFRAMRISPPTTANIMAVNMSTLWTTTSPPPAQVGQVS